ncbi:MAG: SusF/SusE family outer membrane protein [Tannerella sp.]|jgi:hypothetical protein|nr:SusF/SusE family outer membrane protein [Tannerella sp.]
MKKIQIIFLALMALPLSFISCDDDDKPAGPVSVVEDGFYVIGEATSIANLSETEASKALMAAGIDEATEQTARDGMYEKYVALEGGKTFSLVLKEGTKETKYGAQLTLSDILAGDNEPAIQVYKGTLTENAGLQVEKTGLYHIVLDLNKDSKLSDKLILIAPVEWGVRGAMNGWGFTAFPEPQFNKTSMTYTLTDVTVETNGAFKFAYGGGWKIELNSGASTLVKANTNLGSNDALGLKPGGGDITIDRAKYTIELTWKLEKGAIGNGFSYKVTKTEDLGDLPYPETLYMIGEEFGEWKWESTAVAEMTPVHSHPGQFWCIRYFTANKGFKWNSKKEWGGDFNSLGTDNGFSIADGNAVVASDGFYIVLVDYLSSAISIEQAKVYGIGGCFDADNWETGKHAFTPVPTTKTMNITTALSGELRMYAASTATAADWWQMEFILNNGQIVYRGTGEDQERFTVEVGKTVTLDFNNGTGTIQ